MRVLKIKSNKQDPDIRREYKRVKALLLAGRTDPVQAVQTLFHCGYELDRQGAKDEAEVVYSDTIEALETIHSTGSRKLGLADVAAVAFDHGRNLYALGKVTAALSSFKEAAERYEVLISFGVSISVVEKFAQAVRWLALTQRRVSDIKRANESYKQAIALYRSLLAYAPSASKRREYETFLTGVILGYRKCRTLKDRPSGDNQL